MKAFLVLLMSLSFNLFMVHSLLTELLNAYTVVAGLVKYSHIKMEDMKLLTCEKIVISYLGIMDV